MFGDGWSFFFFLERGVEVYEQQQQNPGDVPLNRDWLTMGFVLHG